MIKDVDCFRFVQKIENTSFLIVKYLGKCRKGVSDTKLEVWCFVEGWLCFLAVEGAGLEVLKQKFKNIR